MAYSTISKPSLYFNTKLYTGTGSELAITGVGFQPDFVWTKSRSNTLNHNLYDAVRGVTKGLKSNTSDAEFTEAQSLKSFDSGGFTIGTDSHINTSSATFASWNWKAGGSASSNSNGSITSSVSASTDAGFSIVAFTGNGTSGATVGHGLGVAPKVIMVKSRSLSVAWLNYHSSLGATDFIQLNNTDATTNSSGNAWNDTQPTSSVFSIGSYNNVNTSGATYIAYCFAEKKGYSKFGSYTGNGNADGTFIYTGFKPAFILSKKTNASGTQWTIWDNKRSSSGGGNAIDKILHPNVANAVNTADDTDFLSNGFKLRATASGMNNNGDSYIYMAFAEEPLVANVGASIPATAR
jgi:hypothetical protein